MLPFKTAIRLSLAFIGLLVGPYLSFAQRDYIKSDLLGYAQLFIPDRDAHAVFGPRYNLSYERAMASNISLGMGVSYGLMSGMVGAYDDSLARGHLHEATVMKGTKLCVEGRYYILSESDTSEVLYKCNKGFFVGAYAAFLYGHEITSQRYSDRAEGFQTVATNTVWVYGVGPLVGYKYTFAKRYVIEAVFGFTLGRSKVTSSSSQTIYSHRDRLLNITKLEVSVGYAFRQ